jgi:tyrosinase
MSALDPTPPAQISGTMRVRTNVDQLSADGLSALRQAFSAVMAIDDDRGYQHFAGIHGLPLPIYCQHHNLLFLPWHRAYLYFFEQALLDQVPGASLPWWDWASRGAPQAIPAAYDAAEVDGRPNPLFQSPITSVPLSQWERLEAGPLPTATFRRPGQLGGFPNPDQVMAVLDAPTFTDFSLRLESIHDGVHVWVGGTMSEIPVAAFDPIFWAHHCMIDRLWYLWQLRHPGGDPPRNVRSLALPPFSMTVADTLDINRLGYDYAGAEMPVPARG